MKSYPSEILSPASTPSVGFLCRLRSVLDKLTIWIFPGVGCSTTLSRRIDTRTPRIMCSLAGFWTFDGFVCRSRSASSSMSTPLKSPIGEVHGRRRPTRAPHLTASGAAKEVLECTAN